ncbi:MAG TPA: BamA/TamA family outer membrane protein [Gemmatimonadaceae bacterium]|nr:BamA/TamA family outer membrane protein [Gemmatimonadaceae bacterium]
MRRGRWYARIGAVAMLACASLAASARAQAAQRAQDSLARDTTSDTLSYDDASEIAYLFNAAAAIRNTGPTSIAAGDSVPGNVAVLWGPLTIAGKVHGSVIVVNGPVTIEPGGHVDKDLIVTGGTATGADSSTVGGAVQVHADALRFRQSGELIIAESPEGAEIPDASWFKHWLRRHVRQRHGFTLVGGPYNRVEGLPVIGGPAIRQNIGVGTLRLSVLGIYRSADNFAWKGENLGWHASSELTVGGTRNVRFGIEGYDLVRPTESWQLRDGEVSLASFFLHRDYRDYYNTKGGHAWVSAHAGRTLSLELGVRNERWEPRGARDPFTLLRNSATWRPNPVLDDGRLWIGEALFRFDTRNNVGDPWTGWLIDASLEGGGTDRMVQGPAGALVRNNPLDTAVRVRYTRVLADFTRYNRVSPQSQLNFRLVVGAGFGDQSLPLERRFALGGAGTLPGYDFRAPFHGPDVLSCNAGPTEISGQPALCDRMLLGQIEYRHDSRIRLFARRDPDGAQRFRVDREVAFVAFADGGRGWISGPRAGDLRYPSDAIPSLSTFKYDAGAGIDLHYVGIYLAKSLTDWSNGVNLLIRLRHRF